jgi:hypothetical protein
LKILFYTSGTTGSGRVIKGISIGNALRRKNISAEYTILHHSDFVVPWNDFQFTKIPLEEDNRHSARNFSSSVLYKTLNDLQPDILLVDLLWFPFRHFISELHCKKIFLFSQVDDSFFSLPLAEGTVSFKPGDFDRVISIEPLPSDIPMIKINPLIIRNRDEILPREEALSKLNLNSNENNCLFAFNGAPGEFEEIKKRYSYLEAEGWSMVYSTNYKGGLFPAVDYFNAFDLLICGAGYNAFWEAIYFDKEAIIVPCPRRFENQQKRIELCQEYYFDENGADQLADIMMGM